MCGIVGYIGNLDARKVVIKGLLNLEYRGYDSAGIAIKNKNNEIEIFKDKGRVSHLNDISKIDYATDLAIGHTRWATHGKPNKNNSHPHLSNNKRFVIVHNGVIENYQELKNDKLNNYSFYSQTDTEVIANLIEYYSNKGLVTKDAINNAINDLKGSYALLIIDNQDLNHIYFAKNKTPMLIGTSKDGVVIASDIIPLINYSDKYIHLEDNIMGIISKNEVKAYDKFNNDIKLGFKELKADEFNVYKGDYDHYMMKEIDEQPNVIRKLISHYFDDEGKILVEESLLKQIRESDHIYIAACGTSLHASYIAKYYFEHLCKKQVSCLIASEAAYEMPLLSEKPFFIFVSQSGETADLISVIKECNKLHIPNLGITNSPFSSIDNLSNHVMHLYAGKEISVASTKAYTAQVITFAILAYAVSGESSCLRNNLNELVVEVESILEKKELIKNVAKKFIDAKNCFYIGRGLAYYSSLEAALKLKEISYIHTEGFASGELKHGSIALIEENTPVIALCTNKLTNAITRSNLIETKSRGALGIIISTKECSSSDDDIIINDIASYLTPISVIVVCQLLAYYSSLLRGNDVDKPRNLAKSVTVE